LSETTNILNDITIDFDSNVKQQLISVFEQIENTNILIMDDDYSVKVKLKDESIFAYFPRRFAYNKKLQIREITDDLLSRNVTKVSTPYCARVVLIRKKNGILILCVDLRSLNERVMKQTYSFLVIKSCLAQLGDKSIFTLDFKIGFHQIKIPPTIINSNFLTSLFLEKARSLGLPCQIQWLTISFKFIIIIWLIVILRKQLKESLLITGILLLKRKYKTT